MWHIIDNRWFYNEEKNNVRDNNDDNNIIQHMFGR